MNKKYLLFVIVFIFFSSFIFATSDEIKEQYRSSFVYDEKLPLNFSNFGTYSFYPKINEEVYNINEIYSKTLEYLKKIKLCESSPDIYNCVNKTINLINIEESSISSPFRIKLNGCDIRSEKILFDFAENLLDCANSDDNNCYCERSLDYSSQEIIDYRLVGNHRIEISNKNQDNSLNLKSGNKTISINIGDNLFSNSYYEASFLAFYDVNKKKAIDFANANSVFKVGLKYQNMENNNSIIFYKYTDEFYDSHIDLVNKIGNIIIDKDKNKIENIKSCKLNKSYFRFCTVDTSRILTYSKNLKYDYSNPNVKFAIYLKDIIPPSKPNITNISDNLYFENSVVIKFTNINESDLYKYKVYYTKNQNEINDYFEEIYQFETVYDIDLNRDKNHLYEVKVYYSPDKFEYKKLYPGFAYLINKTNEILYVLKIKDFENYYINVNSLDFSLNENKTIKLTTIKPIDDLGPLSPELILKTENDEKFILKFNISNLNEDKSESIDPTIYFKYALKSSEKCSYDIFSNSDLIVKEVLPNTLYELKLDKVPNACLIYYTTDKFGNPTVLNPNYMDFTKVISLNNN